MSNQTIPRDEWPSFCSAFARRHRGRLVRLDVSGPAGIQHTEAAGALLVDVAAEIAESHEDDVIRIEVAEDGESKNLAIRFPLDVQVEETPAGTDAALFVEAAEQSAILRFRPAFVPEMADGA